MTLSVADALALAHDRDERVDLRILLAHVLGRPIAWLLAHPEAPLDDEAGGRFEALRAERKAGAPIAYLVGEREFHGLSFEVGPVALIPRPETELLVDRLLELFPPGSPGQVVDLGTGTGAIAVTLACRRPHLRIVATDLAPATLDLARRNATRLGASGRIDFRLGDWFETLVDERFDVIVSNPPYIAEDDPHLMLGDLRFEPRTALAGGADGLRDLATIIARAPQHLRSGGSLLLEHGHDQAEAVRQRMAVAGLTEIHSTRDLSGIERITAGRWRIDQPDAPDYAQGLT
jgi:release factor glutamine methyltransferase